MMKKMTFLEIKMNKVHHNNNTNLMAAVMDMIMDQINSINSNMIPINNINHSMKRMVDINIKVIRITINSSKWKHRSINNKGDRRVMMDRSMIRMGMGNREIIRNNHNKLHGQCHRNIDTLSLDLIYTDSAAPQLC